jgi:hypothetical protein
MLRVIERESCKRYLATAAKVLKKKKKNRERESERERELQKVWK